LSKTLTAGSVIPVLKLETNSFPKLELKISSIQDDIFGSDLKPKLELPSLPFFTDGIKLLISFKF
jgi:hypothetical protein